MAETNIFRTIFRTLHEGEGAREAKKAMQETQDTAKNLLGINLKQVVSWAAVGMAVKKVGDYLTDSRDKFMGVAQSVEKVSQATGMDYEESSRLLEVMGDLQIKEETFTTVMEQAQKKGFNPNIESLADLADKYNALTDPLEKANLLTSTLGKSGADLTKFFQQTGDQIRYQTNAVNSNLVMTEKQIETYQEVIDSENELEDTTDGLGLKTGEIVAGMEKDWNELKNGVVTDIAEAYDDVTTKLEGNADHLTSIIDQIRMASENEEDFIQNLKEYGASGQLGWFETTGLKILITKLEETGDAGFSAKKALQMGTGVGSNTWIQHTIPEAKELTETLGTLAEASVATAEWAIKGSLTDAVDKSGEKMDELQEKHAQLTEELGKTATWTDRYKELQGEIGDNEQAQDDLAISLKNATKEIIFQQAAAGLDAKAALTLARQMGILDEANYDVGMAIQEARDLMEADKITEEEYAERIDRINTAWNTYMEMPDYERKVIQFDEYYNKYYGSGYTPLMTPMGTSPTGKDYYADEDIGGASGLDGMVPAGFPNDSYRLKLNLTSGERVQVLTKEQQGTSGAGTSIYGDIYITAQDGDTLDDLMSQVQRARG
jgi:uncharacterized protein Yka (UPF0111/DUF47 family)